MLRTSIRNLCAFDRDADSSEVRTNVRQIMDLHPMPYNFTRIIQRDTKISTLNTGPYDFVEAQRVLTDMKRRKGHNGTGVKIDDETMILSKTNGSLENVNN